MSRHADPDPGRTPGRRARIAASVLVLIAGLGPAIANAASRYT